MTLLRSPSAPAAILRLLLILAVLNPVTLRAETPDPDWELEWRGFGTLGLARSSSDQADYVRDLSQPDGSSGHWTANLDSMLGIQLDAHWSDSLSATLQGVTRYHGLGTWQPEVTWAFAKYTPAPDLTLRAGRLGTEFYMLADSRLVGYASLPVRPNADYFGGLPFFAIDGVDIQASFPLGKGVLRGKLFTGVSQEKVTVSKQCWDLDGARMSGGHLDYLEGAWQWRLGYSQLRFATDPPLDSLYNVLRGAGFSAAADDLGMDGKLSRYLSFGAVYDDGPWQVHLMASRTLQESQLYESGHSGYFLAGYRLGDFTPYLGYSWWKTRPKAVDPSLPPGLAGPTRLTMDITHADQNTFSLGLRWDFQENLALKTQWDRVRGSATSSFPTRLEKSGWDGDTDVLSLTLDFIF